jgi:hypothetical protein
MISRHSSPPALCTFAIEHVALSSLNQMSGRCALSGEVEIGGGTEGDGEGEENGEEEMKRGFAVLLDLSSTALSDPCIPITPSASYICTIASAVLPRNGAFVACSRAWGGAAGQTVLLASGALCSVALWPRFLCAAPDHRFPDSPDLRASLPLRWLRCYSV